MSLKNKFLCTSLALSIGIGFVMPSFSVSAATNISIQSLEEDKQINELAEQLKFLNEEALVIQNGERVFDFNKIENKYGANYANNLKNDIVMIEEMNDAIKDHFGVAAVTAALEGGLWAYLQKKAYKEAAKLLVRFAVGSNAVGLAGTLVYYGGKCTYQHG
ncbi:hypothetical protein [Bacillus cereus]|uniref:Uncharacterized protein n=1 Tax=Bacillus cereus TaxID=1396 RepID=A0AAW5L7K7_BACCE|nr:hypothetical protein [Bacillus cereus]MCQ6289050.1 hypothetical protein [Bacillus cereus]MCQ6318510.1 hypothetical protein [Bacillus cereus]MCQ6330613.1 hypothetical protein [Bacillus cereus]MCQ6386061.1 hypothetical protein [Bacillus cereus]